MPEIISQDDCKKARSIPFCYLCGKPLSSGGETNRDHIPPRKIFRDEDRNWPLILKTHTSCNEKQSEDDEVIGQIVALCWGKSVPPRRQKFKVNIRRYKGNLMPGISGVPIQGIIWRWVRGFHAALYREFLPATWPGGNIFTPFPRSDNTDPDINRALFSKVLIENRRNRTLDRIITQNGKCIYECAWATVDDGRTICVFGLRLYDWEKMGPQADGPRGCVGLYSAVTPKTATLSTDSVFSVKNGDSLDPFETS
ncbi:MAG: hypothetical protein E3J72_14320 [Planctomycetota bacterium]|nr:MAG: hypothetical protein E3J72_14320 [Planctomycetota bacterium]